MPLREMIEVVAEEMGVEPDVERLPVQPGDVERTWAEISKAHRLFGYDPEWDFREGGSTAVHRHLAAARR